MTQKYTVVVTDVLTGALELERGVLADLADVVALDSRVEADLVGRVENADAIMVYHLVQIGEATLQRLQKCKLIVRCGVGVDNIDLAAARRFGIPVANVPDYGTEEVADSAIGLMLSMTRGIAQANSRLRAATVAWDYAPFRPLMRLRGEVFGIVGLGRIGTAAAIRAKALGMHVIFYDPYKPDGYDKALGIRRVESLRELLQQSFVVSLHCPLTSETRSLMNAETLGQMRRGAYLVNTARGAVVETSAIPAAIASGPLAGAGIDVLPQEPPRDDDPLIQAWRDPQHPAHHRVVLNSHIAFYCEEGLHDMRSKGAEACRRALLGEPIRNVVN